MKYTITAGGREYETTVEAGHVSVDGTPMDLRLLTGDGMTASVVVGGKRVDILLDRSEDGWIAHYDGRVISLELRDERDELLRRFGGLEATQGRVGSIRAPMPGMVLRVGVREGDRVEKGQGVLVLEAMKMENELTAPQAGLVETVHVTGGQAVEKGTALVEIAPEA